MGDLISSQTMIIRNGVRINLRFIVTSGRYLRSDENDSLSAQMYAELESRLRNAGQLGARLRLRTPKSGGEGS